MFTSIYRYHTTIGTVLIFMFTSIYRYHTTIGTVQIFMLLTIIWVVVKSFNIVLQLSVCIVLGSENVPTFMGMLSLV
jgi:hypothetical protein